MARNALYSRVIASQLKETPFRNICIYTTLHGWVQMNLVCYLFPVRLSMGVARRRQIIPYSADCGLPKNTQFYMSSVRMPHTNLSMDTRWGLVLSASSLGRFNPSTYCTGAWVNTRTGFNGLEDINVSSRRESNPDSMVTQHATQLLYLLSYR